MSDIAAGHWPWVNSVIGRPYKLRTWDCFQLLLDGQAAVGLGRAFEPDYRDGPETELSSTLALARNFARGFTKFRRIDTPIIGAAALFRDEGVPVHVGFSLGGHRMVHVNVTTATTIAEIGPRTDYHFSLDGFYVPA